MFDAGAGFILLKGFKRKLLCEVIHHGQRQMMYPRIIYTEVS